MTNAEMAKKVKADREEHIKALMEMRNMMFESDNWESMMRLINAVTAGAFALERLNKEDFGEEVVKND